MSARTFDQIVQGFIDFILRVNPKVDTRTGEVFRDVVIDPPAWEIAQLYNETEVIKEAQSPETARDADLVVLANNFGLVRKSSVKATGMVTFFRYAELTEDITIPAGTIVGTRSSGTDNPVTFVTLNSVTLPVVGANGYYNPETNRYEISTAIRAVFGGASGNVAVGSIVTISNPVPGISGCVNSGATSGGLDQETIENLRVRVIGVLAGNNVNTKYGYYLRAMSDENVSGVLVVGAGDSGMVRQSAGAVDIYIRGILPSPKNEQFTYYPGQQYYIVDTQPVLVGDDYPVTLVGSVTGSLVKGTDWDWKEDTGFYRGSNQSQTAIEWFVEMDEQTITADYYYNGLVSEVQALVTDQHYKGATANVLVFAARRRLIDVACSIKVLPGYAFADVQSRVSQALTSSLDAYIIGQSVEKADLVVVIKGVTGVDDVDTETFDITVEDGEIVPDDYGNIVMPTYSYASAGQMTIEQTVT